MVAELLNQVQAKGIILTVDGDKLHYQGNKSALTPELIEELREHKAEIISLMKCAQCGTLLSGPLNSWWRVLHDTGAVYLCSASCVLKAWPWRDEAMVSMEVAHDHSH
jgi:TubC N-terminal docking domain